MQILKTGFIVLLFVVVVSMRLYFGDVHAVESSYCASLFIDGDNPYSRVLYFSENGLCCSYDLVNNSIGVVCG